MIYNDLRYKGTLASSLGVVVTRQVAYIKPKDAAETVTVPGRHGTLTLHHTHGYEEISYVPTLSVKPGSNLQAVQEWLTGAGEVTFGSMPDYVFDAAILEQVDYTTTFDMDGDWIDIVPTFTCQPLRRKTAAEEMVTIAQSGALITNIGNVPCKPVVTVTGCTDITLTIAGITATVEGIPQGEGIVIDCDMQEVFNTEKTALRNHLMNGNFFVVPSGSAFVTWISTGTPTINIMMNARWL